MKNIYLIPTDKPSRLFIDVDDNKLKITVPIGGEHMMNQNIYITSDEEIKVSDWVLFENSNVVRKAVDSTFTSGVNNIRIHADKKVFKIILTTDGDLIKDGVQAIDDEFLQWYINNPGCELVLVRDKPKVKAVVKGLGVKSFNNGYKIIIPKEKVLLQSSIDGVPIWGEPKQETIEQIDQNNPVTRGSTTLVYKQETTLEEAAKRIYPINIVSDGHDTNMLCRTGFYIGYELAQERMYSEEEVLQLLLRLQQTESYDNLYEWFEQFKKK
jgi:hypothetical protein